MMQQNDMPKMGFISYSRKDIKIAERLERDLSRRGISVWRDLQDIEPGTPDWEEFTRNAIPRIPFFLFLASRNARQSRIVKDELELAEIHKRIIIPLWISGNTWNDAMPLGFGKINHIDLRGERYEEGLEKLSSFLLKKKQTTTTGSLKQVVLSETTGSHEQNKSPVSALLAFASTFLKRFLFFSSNRSSQVQAGPSVQQEAHMGDAENPYQGLHAFTREKEKYFFGRDALIKKMLDEIEAMLHPALPKSENPFLLTVVGPSGSGKSSVIMAGLLPRLERGQDIQGSENWSYLAPFTPGPHPLEALARVLSEETYFADRTISSIREDLRDETTRGLHLLIRGYARQKPGSRIVLLVDQFEEIFSETKDPEERKQFIQLLVTAATESQSEMLIIVTLRADFSGHPMNYPILHEMLEKHRITVGAMNTAELRDVIEKPTKQEEVQVQFEEGLIAELMQEMARQEEALPLLQFTLDQLFKEREGHLITRKSYNKVGGIIKALENHANETYNTLLTEEHKQMAQRLFTRLVNPGGLEQEATRRRASLEEFDLSDPLQRAMMEEVIKKFREAGLLRTGEVDLKEEQRSGSSEEKRRKIYTVEISHEALIGVWTLFGDWIRNSREDILFQQSLSREAQRWEDSEHKRKYLLRSEQLSEAKKWRERNRPSRRETSFLQESFKEAGEEKLLYRRLLPMIFIVLVILLFFYQPLVSSGSMLPFVAGATDVSSRQDDGAGSFRQAVIHTNKVGQRNAVTFVNALIDKDTIDLTSGDLVIASHVIIRNTNQRHIKIESSTGHKIHILPGATLETTNIDFVDTKVQGSSFLFNEGQLTISNSEIAGNGSDAFGGAITNWRGSLTLDNVAIEKNRTSGNGGGIDNWDGQIFLNSNSVISANTAYSAGGGIYTLRGLLQINNSSFVGNKTINADAYGGGIDAINASAFINETIFQKNVGGKEGGGLAIVGSKVDIVNSTITDNTAVLGGAFTVETNGDNDIAGQVVTTNMPVTNTPGGMSYFIGGNHGKDTSNGATTNFNVAPKQDDFKKESFLSTNTKEQPLPGYLGPARLDEFCQGEKKYVSGAALEVTDKESFRCLGQPPTLPDFKVIDACRAQYEQPGHPLMDPMVRLADYYDPSSWQCYQHDKLLGTITRVEDVDAFCRATVTGSTGASFNGGDGRKTAYDWKCLIQSATGQQEAVSLSMKDACAYLFPDAREVFDRLGKFNPAEWQCWAPTTV